MTIKLSPPMIEAIRDADFMSTGGQFYVLRGVKTRTAEALRARGLVTDTRIGEFTEYVLTEAGAVIRVEIHQALTTNIPAEPVAEDITTIPTIGDMIAIEAPGEIVDLDKLDSTLSHAQRLALFQTAFDGRNSGTLARDDQGYGTAWVRGGVATTNALADRGLVERFANTAQEWTGRRHALTPLAFLLVAHLQGQGVTAQTIVQDIADEKASSPIAQAITTHHDLIIKVRGVVRDVIDNPGTPKVGMVAVIASRGDWRRGVIVSVGYKRVTVAYTTDAAVRKSPTNPNITIKSDEIARVWLVGGEDGTMPTPAPDPRASMIHIGTWRESCLSVGCDGCPQNDTHPEIDPRDLITDEQAGADTWMIDQAEHDAVRREVEAEGLAELEWERRQDTQGRREAIMAVPSGMSQHRRSAVSLRDREARKRRRQAQKRARKVARKVRG